MVTLAAAPGNKLSVQVQAPGTTGAQGLDAKAMLIDLNIKTYTGRVLDKKVSKDVAAQYGAPEKVGQYTKNLMAVDEQADRLLKDIQNAAWWARVELRRMTLPWLDDGKGRILPSSLYFEVIQKMGEWERKFNAACEAFYPVYRQLRAAKQNAYRGLFNAAEFPKNIEDRFTFECLILPIPTVNDFRVAGLGHGDIAAAKEMVAETLTTATRVALRDVAERMYEVTKELHDALGRYKKDENGTTGGFHKTLVEKVRTVADLVPKLNITDDPFIAALSERMQGLGRYDAPALKANPEVRKDVMAQADAILSKLNDFI